MQFAKKTPGFLLYAPGLIEETFIKTGTREETLCVCVCVVGSDQRSVHQIFSDIPIICQAPCLAPDTGN